MATQIQSIRGMNDILPAETPHWQQLEATIRSVLASYGYAEVRLPILEKTELFARSIGEVTDIVEKEMYTFSDRNGDSLTLRPEGTAGCVRAGIQNGMLREQQRLWYMGPMFRHERPQQGRYRQFHQIGVETYFMDGPDIDAELILMTARMWKLLGLQDVTLELNSLGSSASRAAYRDILVDWLSQRGEQLDEDSKRRLHSNPLRILDSKNPDMQGLIANAPQLMDHLDDESLAHFSRLRAYLDAAGIAYVLNPRLVRGLDYYGRTVFEWTTTRLGAQGTICAGGRYDGLVEQLGGKPVPAVGFAMGLERLVALLREDQQPEPRHHLPHAYLVMLGEAAEQRGMLLAEELRDAPAGVRLKANVGGGSMKNQMKKAHKSGAMVALLLGEDEMSNAEVAVKYLREERPQQRVALTELSNVLADLV